MKIWILPASTAFVFATVAATVTVLWRGGSTEPSRESSLPNSTVTGTPAPPAREIGERQPSAKSLRVVRPSEADLKRAQAAAPVPAAPDDSNPSEMTADEVVAYNAAIATEIKSRFASEPVDGEWSMVIGQYPTAK